MSVPSKHRAAFVHASDQAPIITERSLGKLNSGEIAIKITATGINPVDWKLHEYGLNFAPHWHYPRLLGSDGSGTVAAVGPDVLDFGVGDRVFFQSGYMDDNVSTFQEYVKLPAVVVAKTPKNITDEEASGIVVASMAAATALYDKTGQGLPPPWERDGRHVGKGKAIIIMGGSSSVGQYAIQFARLSGFERIITNASTKHHAHLRDLGAHIVLDRHAATLEEFRTALNGLPLEFVFDAIANKETQLLEIEILQSTNSPKAPNLRVVSVGMAIEEAIQLGACKEPHVAYQFIQGLALKPELRYLIKGLVDHLGGEIGWVATGEFKPNRVHVIEGGLDKIYEGMETNKHGVSGVKVVVKF
ncbi:hypothetical protein SVAN01_09667 [Stagonosporopsis vannaccii]|nr:hypothetical protein SVAN01_09667 [Stagonosporopsis vannaccii]